MHNSSSEHVQVEVKDYPFGQCHWWNTIWYHCGNFCDSSTIYKCQDFLA